MLQTTRQDKTRRNEKKKTTRQHLISKVQDQFPINVSKSQQENAKQNSCIHSLCKGSDIEEGTIAKINFIQN